MPELKYTAYARKLIQNKNKYLHLSDEGKHSFQGNFPSITSWTFKGSSLKMLYLERDSFSSHLSLVIFSRIFCRCFDESEK